MKRLLYLTMIALLSMGVQCKKEKNIVREGLVNFMAGTVVIVDGGDRKPAAIGDAIRQGMIIETGTLSFVDIYFDDSAIKILEESVVEIRVLGGNLPGDAVTSLLHVTSGRVFNRVVKKLVKNDRFEVSSPTMVAAVRGTEFLVVSDEVKSLIACLNGSVEVQNETAPDQEPVLIRDEQEVVVEKDKPMTVRDLSEENRKLLADIKKDFKEMKKEIRERFEKKREEIRKSVEDRRQKDMDMVERRKAEDIQKVEDQKARDRENVERLKATSDATSAKAQEGVERRKEEAKETLQDVKPDIKKFKSSID